MPYSSIVNAAAVGTVIVIALTGCGRGPTAPGTDAPVGLVTAPLSPPNGTTVAAFGTASFVASHAAAHAGAMVLITFEFDTDAQFSAPLRQSVVRQDAGGSTTLVSDLSFGLSLVGRTIYWRVRAGTGEVVGDWSRAAQFVVGPAVNPEQLFAGPPTPVSPLSVVVQQRGVALTAREGPHSGGPVAVRFYWSADPGLANASPCIGSLTPEPGTHVCRLDTVTPGTYYWRAQTLATRSGTSFAQGVASAFSQVASFTVAAADIRAPQSLSSGGELVHPRPTIVFQNARRSGNVGPLRYRFEIATSGEYSNSVVLTSALVPEGAGSTSWTVPIDLMVDTTYTAFVHAVDSVSGFESPAGHWAFLVINRQHTLATLDITSSCRSSSVSAAFQGRIGNSPFSVRTLGSLALSLFATGEAGRFAGTLAGGSSGVFIAGPDGGSPASTVGILQPDGTLAGSLDGVASYSSPFLFSCPTGPIHWSLRPREPGE